MTDVVAKETPGVTGPGASVPGAAARGWIVTVACAAVAVIIASMAALYTALPDIATASGATQAQLTWIVDGYTLALACLVLPAGAVGDRYGRRVVLVAGLAVFTAGSVLPLLVQEPVWIIAARVLAGAGAAAVMPSTLSLLTGLLPADRRAGAIGLWAGVAGAAGVVGIVGSGALVQVWSWESIFIVLSAAGAVMLLCVLTLPESRSPVPPRIDAVGGVLVAAGLGLLVFGIISGPEHGWASVPVLATIGGGLVLVVAFVVTQLRMREPLLDVRLFRSRGFSAGALSLTVQFGVTFGVFLILIQYLQLVLGYSPFGASLAIAPMMAPLMLVAMVSPRIAERVGLKAVMVAGMAAIAFGLLMLRGIDADSGYVDVLWPVLIMSAGLGLTAAPATGVIVSEAPADKQGVAAAVNDATREVGASLGIAVAGSLLAAGYASGIAPVLDRLPAAARGPVEDSLAGALAVAEHAGPSAGVLEDVAERAFLDGVASAGLVLACAAAVGAVFMAVLAPGRGAARRRPAREDVAAYAPEPGRSETGAPTLDV
ncbi:MFS transporter [Tomitella fengzijianii]|uniref:MFS transporter n=1 Tax=Tomitella fengzijianii TaxID=2597660 RepID=A0A516X4U9_9ACTN|nr:MFS transporter [Tomitella fengzijianii]QDQ98102.1 MFS transporter [Tomitella fengzijianii]